MTLPALPLLADQAAAGGNLIMLVAFAAMAVMLFVSARRSRRLQQRQAEMRSSLTPGVEVMTGAGIFGTVVRVDEAAQRVTLEVSPGTRMDVHLQGVVDVVDPADAPAADDDRLAGAATGPSGAHAADLGTAPQADTSPRSAGDPDVDPRTDRG